MKSSDETLNNIAFAIKGYYDQLDINKLSENDFDEWIESLKSPMKEVFKKEGINKCKGFLNFQRFVLEMNDNGLDHYLEKKLSEQDFAYYQLQNEN